MYYSVSVLNHPRLHNILRLTQGTAISHTTRAVISSSLSVLFGCGNLLTERGGRELTRIRFKPTRVSALRQHSMLHVHNASPHAEDIHCSEQCLKCLQSRTERTSFDGRCCMCSSRSVHVQHRLTVTVCTMPRAFSLLSSQHVAAYHARNRRNGPIRDPQAGLFARESRRRD